MGLSRNRASEIVGNANFGEIDTLLSQGHDMDYIATHYHMDLALPWSLRLEGKTDQEKFKELSWGLVKFAKATVKRISLGTSHMGSMEL